METIAWISPIKKIFENNRNFFVQQNQWLIRENTFNNIEKILACGTQTLWFTSFRCDCCWETKHIPFTCKSRFCNSCSQPQSDLWMNKLISWWPSWLLYHHVTFTIPQELRIFFKRHRNALKILPYTAAWSVRYFVKKQQKIDLGILWVIHTFWAKLNRNPHTHLLISHWGFHQNWSFKRKIFLPYNAIATSRTRFLIKYLKIRAQKNLSWNKLLSETHFLNSFYDYHSRHTGKKANRYVDFWWKPRQFQQVIGYLWRYLKRPAISQSRILSYDQNNVTFSYLDKRDKKTKTISCSPIKFIWLLTQHLPDKNFRMLYYYWLFANRCKKKYISLINTYFDHSSKLPTIPTSFCQRLYFFTWKNPLLCSCWWVFYKYKITLPWYPTKYFDSW